MTNPLIEDEASGLEDLGFIEQFDEKTSDYKPYKKQEIMPSKWSLVLKYFYSFKKVYSIFGKIIALYFIANNLSFKPNSFRF